MTKFLVTGVAAMALMSGAAFAQAAYGTMSSSTEVIHSSRMAPPPPPPEAVTTVKKEEIVDVHGNTVVKRQTVTTEAGAQASTSTSKTIAPDGSVMTQRTEERSTTPFGETRSTTRTVTTDR